MALLGHQVEKIMSIKSRASHDYHNVFMKAKHTLSHSSETELRNSRILVIGCGYNYPETLLWSTVSEHTVGIDLRKAFWSTGFSSLLSELRDDGTPGMRACATAMVQLWTFHSYFRHLTGISGLSFNDLRQDLVTYDGLRLPFADDSFDIIYSNAVLEHVANLDALSEEMRRVTKKNGVCYHLWHNYYSLSGAHVPSSFSESLPWGHLLGDTRVDDWLRFTKTYLNKKRPDEIADVLSRDFDKVSMNQMDECHNMKDVDSDFRYEGEDRLNPDLRERMIEYPLESLLTRAYLFLGRKK